MLRKGRAPQRPKVVAEPQRIKTRRDVTRVATVLGLRPLGSVTSGRRRFPAFSTWSLVGRLMQKRGGGGKG